MTFTDRVYALIAAGKNTAEIRDALREHADYTPGKISGVVHRLRLLGLHVPVGSLARSESGKKANGARKTKSQNPRKDNPPKVPGEATAKLMTAMGVALPDPSSRPPPQPRVPRVAARPRVEAPPPKPLACAPVLSNRICSWVDGDRKAWVMCEERALVGVPFCERHAAIGIESRRRQTSRSVDQQQAPP